MSELTISKKKTVLAVSSFPGGVGLGWFSVDYGLWINDPFLEIFSGPLPSVYAHTFTSGEVVAKLLFMHRIQGSLDPRI